MKPMNRPSVRVGPGRVITATFGLGLVLLTGPVRAQTPDAAADLQRLQTQMVEMQRVIQQLQAEVAALKGAPSRAPSAAPAATPPLQSAGPAANTSEQVRGDALSVARVDNTPLDPTRKGFVEFPGTDAAFSLSGYAKLDAIYDPRRAGNPDKFFTSSIPVGVPESGQYSNLNIHARQTRISLNLIKGTQNTSGGPLRFFVEADFFGSSGDSVFHMRHAYGSKANLVAGYTWSTLADPDAYPDSLDMEMPPGTTQNRQAQVRYTAVFGKDRHDSLAFSVEKPASDVTYAGITNVNRYPDVMARFRHEFGRGHIQLSTAFRSIGASDQKTTTATAFGMVGNFLGSVGVLGEDRLVWGVIGGPGAAHYIDNLTGLGLDAAVDVTGRELEAVTSVSAYAGYQHHWTHALRSTVSYGYDEIESNGHLSSTAIRRNHYVLGNLIMQVTKSSIVGLEYLHGRNERQDGQEAWADRFQFSLKYDLTK